MRHAFVLGFLVAACSSSTTRAGGGAEPTGGEPTWGIAAAGLREDCDGLAVVTVTPEAIELVRMARAIPRRDGAVDADALLAELVPADENATCAHAIEIGARGKVTYQDLVAVIDVAITAGRTDVGLIGGRTGMYPTKRRPKQPTDDEMLASLAKPKYDPAITPIIIISSTSIVVKLPSSGEGEVVIDDEAPLGDEPSLQHLQERLREARAVAPAASEDAYVLQADRATPAQLVIDTTSAARAAGYTQILFAVKRAATP